MFVNVAGINITGNVIPQKQVNGDVGPYPLMREDMAFLLEAHEERFGSWSWMSSVPHRLKDGCMLMEDIIRKMEIVKDGLPSYIGACFVNGVYKSPATQISQSLIAGAPGNTSSVESWLATHIGAAWPALLTDGYAVPRNMQLDCIRRIYSDIDKFKLFVCNVSSRTYTSGTWVNWGGATGTWSNKRMDENVSSAWPYYATAGYYALRYSGEESVGVATSDVNSAYVEVNMDNVKDVYMAIKYVAFVHGGEHVCTCLVPLQYVGSSPASGYRTRWSVPHDYLTSAYLRDTVCPFLDVSPIPPSSGGELNVMAYETDCFVATIDETKAKAEVASLGWRYVDDRGFDSLSLRAHP